MGVEVTLVRTPEGIGNVAPEVQGKLWAEGDLRIPPVGQGNKLTDETCA